MVRTQVYIPDDLLRRVKLLTKQTGKNQSQLLREGLWIMVANLEGEGKKKTLDDMIGAFHCEGADPDAAINHNDIYNILPWEENEK
jgi:hypothetical protein